MSADQIVHPVPRATCTPAIDRVLAAYALIADVDRPEVWIDLRHESRALSDAAAVDARTAAGEHLPLAGLVVAIAAINAWNRINAATRQITGEWVDQWVSRTDPASQAA